MTQAAPQDAGAGLLDRSYSHAQDAFKAGLVTIVGSGASCGYGLPGMAELADEVLSEIPTVRARTVNARDLASLEAIESSLRGGVALEEALGGQLTDFVLGEIRRVVASAFIQPESRAVEKMIADPNQSPYAKLFERLLATSHVADVVTTNYDRLIEVAASLAQRHVDTMFWGSPISHLDQTVARLEAGVAHPKGAQPTNRHIRLAKPHGSLDWRFDGCRVLRSEFIVPAPHIIPPTIEKYRAGYRLGFQDHVNRAFKAIHGATGLLFIGFGFNDLHLQEALGPKLAAVPSIVLTKSLTVAARNLLDQSPQMLAIEEDAATGGSVVTLGGSSTVTTDTVWDLEGFLRHVFADPRREA